jgi:amino acid permease
VSEWDFLDRDQVLAGLPARRANTLLFLIESRTAHLVARSRQAMEWFLTEEAAQERELAFLEAFSLGQDPPLRPTIQDLERHASSWAELVAKNPRVQAAVAHLLGRKYEFTRAAVPDLRAALGLDEPAVKDAYQRLYHEPLETIYAERPGFSDRVRWAWSSLSKRLETLPPFWTAYSLTLTETVGATILALPIALAAIGPLPGLAILVVFGLVNMCTVAFLAEAISRSGAMRYGSTFFGRLASDYLGRGGAMVVTASVFVLCLLVLPVFYTGFAGTLHNATSVPSAVWVALLFVVGLYYLRKQTLNSTIASALVIGAACIALVVALSLLGFAHANSHNLLYERVPFVNGRPFQSAIVALIFGVILTAYFGHMSVALCGQLVLRRDPSGRSLIRGCAAAQATAILLYCVFVLAVNGAVAPHVLSHDTGTALGPLASAVGPAAKILGSVFVILGLGLGSVTFSLALFGVVTERLPSASPAVLALPRRSARLLFARRPRPRSSDALQLSLTYLGLDAGQPRFRLDAWRGGEVERFEVTGPGQGKLLTASGAQEFLARFPELQEDGSELQLEVSEADERSVRLRITSSLKLAYIGGWDVAGLGLADVVALPESEAELIGWINRRGAVSLPEVAEHTGGDAEAARALVAPLVNRGVVAETSAAGEPRYTVRMGPRRGGRLPAEIWQALAPTEADDSHALAPPPGTTRRLRTRLLGRRGRFAIATAPVAASFVAAEWMALTGSGSFAGFLEFVGTIVCSLLAGIFPPLLIVASRHKGEHVPAAVIRRLASPILLGAIYLLFLAGVFLHGLVIWNDPFRRTAALLAGVGMVAMTVIMIRRGSFASRANIELRDARGEAGSTFSVTADGRAAESEVLVESAEGEQLLTASQGTIPAFATLRRVLFRGRGHDSKETVPSQLKVLVHRVSSEQDSQPVPAHLEVHLGEQARQYHLDPSSGQVVLPITGAPWSVEIKPHSDFNQPPL